MQWKCFLKKFLLPGNRHSKMIMTCVCRTFCYPTLRMLRLFTRQWMCQPEEGGQGSLSRHISNIPHSLASCFALQAFWLLHTWGLTSYLVERFSPYGQAASCSPWFFLSCILSLKDIESLMPVFQDKSFFKPTLTIFSIYLDNHLYHLRTTYL